MAITAPENPGTVTPTIDRRAVTAPQGATIWQAAKAAGIDIPVLRPVHPGVRRHPGQRHDRAQRQGLHHAHRVRPQRPDGRLVVRLGGALTYYVDRDRGAIAYADGREQPGPHGRLCVKGRYGWDYAARGKRGRKPGGLVEYAEMLPHFREATWDEAGLGHPELPEPDLRQPGADRQAVPQPGSADGYIVIPDEATGLDAGSEVTVVLYA